MNHETLSAIGIIFLVVGPLLLFLCRRSLTPLGKLLSRFFKHLLLRLSPSNVVWKWGDSVLGRCPACGSDVSYVKGGSGNLAFECSKCGEKGTVTKS